MSNKTRGTSPFSHFCPECGQMAVWPTKVQWHDNFSGISISDLPVNKCENCGGVIYTHEACEMMHDATRVGEYPGIPIRRFSYATVSVNSKTGAIAFCGGNIDAPDSPTAEQAVILFNEKNSSNDPDWSPMMVMVFDPKDPPSDYRREVEEVLGLRTLNERQT